MDPLHLALLVEGAGSTRNPLLLPWRHNSVMATVAASRTALLRELLAQRYPRARRGLGDDAPAPGAVRRRLPRRPFPRPPARGRRRPGPAQPDEARPRPRRPSGLPRGRRRHHDHEHLHGHPHRPGRLRARRGRLRAEPRRCAARAEGVRRTRRRAAARRGLDGPAEPDALALAQGGRRGVPRGHLRLRAGVLRGAGARARRRRRRSPPDRDDLRHAERQGGDRGRPGRPRGEGRRAAALDLGDDRRPVRADALRPDAGGVLGLGRARRTADRRGQLLARGARDPPPRRGARPPGGLLHELPPERRAAERLRWLRRGPGHDQLAAQGVRRERARQRRRRVLRHHPRPHARHRLRAPRHPAPAGPRAPPPHALQRPRALRLHR